MPRKSTLVKTTPDAEDANEASVDLSVRVVAAERNEWASTRLRDLVFEENERLNRLIRNLYLKFRLGRYPEAELFAHICREIAQYFHTDSCSLHLVRYDSKHDLHPWLELVGAFGPWQEALHPQTARRKQTTHRDLDELSYLTTRAYHWQMPTFLPSRQEFELIRETTRAYLDHSRQESDRLQLGSDTVRERKAHVEENGTMDILHDGPSENPMRHIVWRYTNLYYTSRNMIAVPICRQPNSGLLPIGLLKIENRTPRGLRGFSMSAGPRDQFFDELWGLASLYPYLKDLKQNVDKSLFVPVHNNESWRMRYQDNKVGLEYFDSLRRWLKEKQQKFDGGDDHVKAQLKQLIAVAYQELCENLLELLRFLSEAEALLQNVSYAQAILSSQSRDHYAYQDNKPVLSIPSFFNAHNLVVGALIMAGLPGSIDSTHAAISQPATPVEEHPLVECLKAKLEQIILRPESDTSMSGSTHEADLITQVMSRIFPDGGSEAIFDRDGSVKDIAVFLDGIPDGNGGNSKIRWDIDAAVMFLLERVADIAVAIDEVATVTGSGIATDGQSGPLPSYEFTRVLAEETVTRRIVEQILRHGKNVEVAVEETRKIMIERAEKDLRRLDSIVNDIGAEDGYSRVPSNADESHPNSVLELAEGSLHEIVTMQKVRLALLGKWSAAATMGAHTFDERDASRLMFVAGHVTQVLDNSLMQQARQREIPVGYSEFALLGLDADSLEWIDDIQMLARIISDKLQYLFNRDLRQQGDWNGGVTVEPLDMKRDLFAKLRDEVTSTMILRLREGPRPTSAGFGKAERQAISNTAVLDMPIIRIRGNMPSEASSTVRAIGDWASTTRVDRWSVRATFVPTTAPNIIRVQIPLRLLAYRRPHWIRDVKSVMDALLTELRNV